MAEHSEKFTESRNGARPSFGNMRNKDAEFRCLLSNIVDSIGSVIAVAATPTDLFMSMGYADSG